VSPRSTSLRNGAVVSRTMKPMQGSIQPWSALSRTGRVSKRASMYDGSRIHYDTIVPAIHGENLLPASILARANIKTSSFAAMQHVRVTRSNRIRLAEELVHDVRICCTCACRDETVPDERSQSRWTVYFECRAVRRLHSYISTIGAI
jgi:hypothetical protein